MKSKYSFFTAETPSRGEDQRTLKHKLDFLSFSLSLRLCVSAVMLLFAANVNAQMAIKGELVYTMDGSAITNGVVLIKDGKIEMVGKADSVTIPSGYTIMTAKVVTPGLIDAHSVIGLNGALNQPHDQMALETSSSMQPELRAIDAYNAEEVLIAWVRSFGVTTVHTGHQPGALISGQTMVAKTFGKGVDGTTIVPTAMIAATLGTDANAAAGKSPGTRAKQVALLRAELIKATEASKKTDAPKDLRSMAMMSLIRREIPLLITVNKAQDIMTAIRIAKEFNLRVVLDGVADAQLVMDEIKASGFPVIVHPTMARPTGDAAGLSMEDAAKLKAAGIPVALQSGYEGYVPKTRVVLYEAGMAAANGMSKDDALALITIDAAKILGLDARIGSLKAGKDADLALYDGDPFEWTTHCTTTIINGKVVNSVPR